ncbi:DNA methyltransferase [uncultured Novosphingobium sp.]|uniref:DNA methyltransferase n=1 Tax=uncultured Novosphingobium sp. TaxID=292277 RepID=UPI00259086B4|nr:DNA methyltransferase [uncultured Novosphingobium sp.]
MNQASFQGLEPASDHDLDKVREAIAAASSRGRFTHIAVPPIGDALLVKIGPHSLYLSDAYALRPGLGFFDAEVMDPPYRFNNSGGGAYRKARGASDQIVAEKLDQGFDISIINPLRAGAVVVFCHNDQLPELLTYVTGRFRRSCLLSWIKKNPSPMRNKHYLADVEPFIHAWNPGFHPVGEHHDLHRWIMAGTMPAKVFGHATVKPAEVMSKIVRALSGRTVIDPFMGTGSTGVAAIGAGRVFTGIEKNPKHFATAVARITAAYEAALAESPAHV